MTAIVIHQGILLLARERLGQIRDLMAAKVQSGLAVSPMERQIRYLATSAHDMLSAAPQSQADAPTRTFASALGRGVSTFAVMGSLGPWIGSYAAQGATGREWIGKVLRAAAPHDSRELVNAHSFDFLLKLIERADALIDAIGDEGEKRRARAKLRAYALGHASRIAGDLLVNPILDDIEAHHGGPLRANRFARSVLEETVDAVVADAVFHAATRRGATWTRWWPSLGDVPDQLWQAYSEAFTATYFLPNGQRRKGSAESEAALGSNIPEMTPRLVKNGYESFYLHLQQGYDWTYPDWVGAFALAFLPSAVAMPFIVLLPQGKYLFQSNPAEGAPPITLDPDPEVDPPLNTPTEHFDEGKAWAEALALPLSATSWVPLVYVIYTMSKTYLGTSTDSIVALVASIAVLICGIVNISTSGVEMAGWVRGLFLYGLPVLIDVVAGIYLLARNAGEPYHQLLAIVFFAHAVLSFLTTLWYGALREWIGMGPGHSSGKFWGAIVIWLVILCVPWLLLPLAFMGRAPAEAAVDEMIRRRHNARVYDDASLFHLPSVESPTLADMHYPSGRRKMLKIWWTGQGVMHIRPRGTLIEFHLGDLNVPGNQVVMMPLAPMKLTELMGVMKREIHGTDAQPGLRVELAFPGTDEDYDLPPGEVFADHGDAPSSGYDPDATTLAQSARDAKADEFHVLPTNVGGDPYYLYHAPKTRQASRLGRRGVEVVDYRTGADTGHAAVQPSTVVGAGANDLEATAGGTFLTYFRVGDAIQVPPAGAASAITAIIDDQHITTQHAMGLGPATAVNRVRHDRTIEVRGPGTVSVAAGSTTVAGSATTFRSFFLAATATRPGDVIRINGIDRVVTTIAAANDVTLTVDSPFSTAAIPAGTNYHRMPTEARDGWQLVPTTSVDLPGGETVMEQAADLAALLCMGVTSRLLGTERLPPPTGHAPSEINEVAQIFRNWNLDRRRLNEWRMLVTGQATSEKRGAPADPDPMLSPLPRNWTLRSTRGDKVADAQGWVPLLRKWLDVARRPGVSITARTSLYAGDPTNLELSRAMAYLLDMTDPDATPP